MVGDVNLFFGEESEGAGEINMMIAGSEQAMYNFFINYSMNVVCRP